VSRLKNHAEHKAAPEKASDTCGWFIHFYALSNIIMKQKKDETEKDQIDDIMSQRKGKQAAAALNSS